MRENIVFSKQDASSLSHEHHEHEAKKEPVFVQEEEMTPEEREYFQKYRKLYERPVVEEIIPEPAIQTKALVETPVVYDEVAREVEKRLAKKWGNPGEERPASYAVRPSATVAVEEEPISENPSENSELPSLKDLLKDLEHEKLSGDDADPKNLDKDDIDNLIHRITHDY